MTHHIGQVLDGKYELVKLLGQGGMGAVYEARHTLINRTVAIKLLREKHAGSERARDRFFREAKAASAVHHRAIVEIFDVGRADDGTVYIVMELLRGKSVAELIKRDAPLPPRRSLSIVIDVLRGLDAAHGQGVIHRDLKPENVFLSLENDAEERTTIVDFGISKAPQEDESAPSELTTTGELLGTPYYMAPEQIRNSKKVDHRADLWAAGVLLFELLTGTRPFVASNASELLAKILIEPPPDLPGSHAPAELQPVLTKALDKDPVRRFQSAAEFAAELETLVAALPPTSAVALRQRAVPETGRADQSKEETDQATLDEGTDTSVSQGSSPFAGTGKALAPADPEGQEQSEATHGQQPAAPLWKRCFWYVLMSPFVAAPLLFSITRPAWIATALGLPETLPAIATWLLAGGVSIGLGLFVWRAELHWRSGGASQLFQGWVLVVCPACGLALCLIHFLTVRGQTSSYALTLRSYMALDMAQASELSSLLALSHERFLLAITFDQLGVAVLALVLVVSYLFVPREPGPRPASARPWLVIPCGLLLIGLAHGLVFPEALSWMGVFAFVAYLLWVLTAVAAVRLAPQSRRHAAEALWTSLVALFALVGTQLALGYVMLLDILAELSGEDFPPGDREWMYSEDINPNILLGLAVELSLLLLLYGATAAVCLRGTGQPKLARSARKPLVAAALTAVPVAILLGVMDGAAFQWAALKVAHMAPMSTSEEAPRSFYIDRDPQGLYVGRRGLLAGITGQKRQLDVSPGSLTKELGDRPGCEQMLGEALRREKTGQARCVTAIEARIYCEGLGKRLPTPEEWAAASGSGALAPGPAGEWTMRMVHGTPTFDIATDSATGERSELFATLSPDQYSKEVGFRCAWSYDNMQ